MLNEFLKLLGTAESVLVSNNASESTEISEDEAEPPALIVLRPMKVEVSPVTGEADNQVVRLFDTDAGKDLVLHLTEEGILGGRFLSQSKEFEVFDAEGDAIRVCLQRQGESLCPPVGFETYQGPAFMVIQEGGSSTELYLHSLCTRASAAKHQGSCWDDGAYRTSEIVEVPASLASHPDFFAVAEALVRATLTIQSRGSED